jgi:peptide/nickel transport system permease protein
MARFLLQRIITGLVTIFVTTIAVTFLIHLVPGDPVRTMYAQSQGTTPEQIEEIRQRLGLDRPILEQYGAFMGRLFQGDLGQTIRGQQDVLSILVERIPNTLVLAVAAMLVALVVGVPIGFFAAARRGRLADTGLMALATTGVAIPHFWLGLLFLTWFTVDNRWFPVTGSGPLSLVLPALTLGLASAAVIARMTRAAMIDVLSQDFVRTAEAKGLRRGVILRRHVLRAGLVPVVTMSGLQFAAMMGGAIVVENIFAWNGVGRLAIDAILQRDYPLIQGFILSFAVIVVTVSILLDVVYAFLDPRIRRAA